MKRVYRLIYTSQAVKYLDSLKLSTAVRIRDKIRTIQTDPWRYTKPLVNMDGLRKLRVGDYRVILSTRKELPPGITAKKEERSRYYHSSKQLP